MSKIIIAKEFTDKPGSRFYTDGEYSGEQFREEILRIRFEEALKKDKTLEIDFDGAYGYGTSFLEESFGGLSELYGAEKVLKHLKFKSDEQDDIIDKVIDYIKNRKKKKGK